MPAWKRRDICSKGWIINPHFPFNGGARAAHTRKNIKSFSASRKRKLWACMRVFQSDPMPESSARKLCLRLFCFESFNHLACEHFTRHSHARREVQTSHSLSRLWGFKQFSFMLLRSIWEREIVTQFADSSHGLFSSRIPLTRYQFHKINFFPRLRRSSAQNPMTLFFSFWGVRGEIFMAKLLPVSGFFFISSVSNSSLDFPRLKAPGVVRGSRNCFFAHSQNNINSNRICSPPPPPRLLKLRHHRARQLCFCLFYFRVISSGIQNAFFPWFELIWLGASAVISLAGRSPPRRLSNLFSKQANCRDLKQCRWERSQAEQGSVLWRAESGLFHKFNYGNDNKNSPLAYLLLAISERKLNKRKVYDFVSSSSGGFACSSPVGRVFKLI